MIPSRILAVLLISIFLVACRGSRGEGAVPWYNERSYRVEKMSTVSADGSIFVELADDVENNGSESGKNFWVHIRNLSVGFSPSSTGTYIWVRGVRMANGKIDLSHIYEAKISVRKEEQRKKWEDFISEQKDILYGPKDVFPPQPQTGR